MVLAAASLCMGALRKEPPMPPPASPSVTTGHLGCSRTGAGNMPRGQIPPAILVGLGRMCGWQDPAEGGR